MTARSVFMPPSCGGDRRAVAPRHDAIASALVLDRGDGAVAAAGGFGVPLALGILELDDLGGAGFFLFGGGRGRGHQRGSMGRIWLGKHAVDLVSPAAVVLDDLIRDFGHRDTFGMNRISGLNVSRWR